MATKTKTKPAKARKAKDPKPKAPKAKTKAAEPTEPIAPAPADVMANESTMAVPTSKEPTRTKRTAPSALDAAARVLAEAGQPMTCKALIDAMADAGYWTSPKGKTPHATLNAAIHREIKARGKDARFHKAGRGQFAHNPNR